MVEEEGEHHGSELIGYILGVGLQVHVAIHLLRLAKKKGKGLEQSLRFVWCVFGLMWCLFCSASCSGTGKVIIGGLLRTRR